MPITIRTEEGDITAEQEVANSFNQFFIDKISNLKTNIDPSQVKDPLDKLEANMSVFYFLPDVFMKSVIIF